MAISANAGEYKSVIGLDSVYIARVTQDDSTAYVAGTPEYLAPAAELGLKPVVSQETQYADNQPFDVMASEAETDMEITVTNLPAEMQAMLTGSVFDAATGRVFDNAGVPPYFALGFRALKSNGNYRYYWFYKVQFSAPEEGAVTRADKATPQPAKMTAKAVKTVHKFTLSGSVTDGAKRTYGDQDTTSFDPTGWFLQVQAPGVTTPSALALSSSVPTAGATGVSVSANLTLTYNNALTTGSTAGVTLINSTTGAVIAGAVTLDATRKIVTIDPTASLAAATQHRIIASVVDIYGQTLTSVVSFTTA